MEHFDYDPFEHIPREQATVGALRAQATDIDLSLKRGGGGKSPSDYETGFVTIGDVVQQMASAISTPME